MKGLPAALKKALKAQQNRASFVLGGTVAARSPQHKYKAIASECLYGHRHPSRKEAMWCLKLHEMAKEGSILFLVREPSYELKVQGVLIAVHKPDFAYYTLDAVAGIQYLKRHIVEVKGVKTPEWKLKHKLFMALNPDINYQVM